jgi:hypothetical protein
MVIAKPGPEPHWAYRHAAVDRVLAAVTEMMMGKVRAKVFLQDTSTHLSPSP